MMDNLGSVVLCWLQEFQALLLALMCHNLPICKMAVYRDFVVLTDFTL